MTIEFPIRDTADFGTIVLGTPFSARGALFLSLFRVGSHVFVRACVRL